jgi:hypothetical protein
MTINTDARACVKKYLIEADTDKNSSLFKITGIIDIILISRQIHAFIQDLDEIAIIVLVINKK